MSVRTSTLALILALATTASVAQADAYDAAFSHAIAAKERALDENDPAAWEEALERFRRADRLRATKECKYELASAAALLRQSDVAYEAYEAALSLGLDGPAAEKARAFLDGQRSSLGRLDILGPDGAEVRVAGRLRGTLPLLRPLVVFAGEANVELQLGDRRVQRRALVTAGSQASLDARLAFTTPSLPPANPPPDGPGPDPAPTKSESNPARPWLLGTGIGLTTAGIVTVVLASTSLAARRDDLASHCAVPDGSDDCRFASPELQASAQSDVDAIATWKGVRVAGWAGLGLGLGLGTAALLLPNAPAEPAPRAHARIYVTPQSIGVLGAF